MPIVRNVCRRDRKTEYLIKPGNHFAVLHHQNQVVMIIVVADAAEIATNLKTRGVIIRHITCRYDKMDKTIMDTDLKCKIMEGGLC